ncbi:hypothetical protein ACJIZ3_003966 [Penstemon smallii]|uniref:EamA domain-containing protein n=1 Tax=Penstemon smallii TaxID=265156 RepID=A0ABD3S0S4_9LAMI
METKFVHKAKIYVAVILLQFGFAGFAIVAKFALNRGTSHYTFAVYRNAIAAVVFAPFAFVLERKIRPKMTLNIFLRIVLLGLLDPVMGQNLFYAGMNQTTATFTSAMSNVLPALTFIMAWILSQAKIVGTVVTVGGAMIMTLIAGPVLGLPWTKNTTSAPSQQGAGDDDYVVVVPPQNPMRGALMIAAGNFGYALFYILQAMTLKKAYPAGLSLTAMICASGALQGTVLTFIIERGNIAIWSIGFNATLLAYAYGGIISSGVTYYVSGIIMKEKGPVFVTAFNPLSMVIVAILSSFIFAEQLELGKIVGAVVIVMGLYLVIWGKSTDQSESSKIASGSELPIHQQQQTVIDTVSNSSTKDLKSKDDAQLPQSLSHNNSMWNLDPKLVKKLKIYVGVVLLQFGFAGFAIIAKFALNKGTSHYVFLLEFTTWIGLSPLTWLGPNSTSKASLKVRPKMTLSILLKIMLLGLLDPIIGQNLFYAGMKYTSATFTAAMCNVLPALTFLMAWILRLEKVKLKRLYDQAKVLGTIVTIGGAMIMTLVRGHVIGFPWNKEEEEEGSNYYSNNNINVKDHQEEPIKGTIMITIGCFCWSIFYILQANTLKTYPAGLTLTTLICMAGALQGGALTLVVERTNPQVWSIGWDVKLLAYAYAGIVSSGVGYYVSGVVSKEKGAVFLTSFNPLSMVVVAVMSSFIFADKLDVGKVTGASVIIIGLYLVIWSRTMDQNESVVCTSSSSPDDPIQQQNHDDSKFVSESQHNNNNNNRSIV